MNGETVVAIHGGTGLGALHRGAELAGLSSVDAAQL
jgi:hypothetical protein